VAALADRLGVAHTAVREVVAGQLVRFDGAYLRFVGDLQISRYRAGELVETYKDDAIWELMYFGHAAEGRRPGLD
jgi:pyruvate dehydrogenase complex dehydrogenase (E1) component